MNGGLALFDDLIASDPNFGMVHFFRAVALLRVERFDAARTSVERAIALTELTAEMLARRAETKAYVGDINGARAALAELLARRSVSYTPAVMVALVHVALSEYDEAMNWLRTAETERDVGLIYLTSTPAYAPLEARADFAALTRAVGLAPARN